MPPRTQPGNAKNDRGVPDLARDAVDDLTSLISAQGRLVRLELFADFKLIAQRLVGLAVYIPVFLLGYAFAMFALATALGPILGLSWSLLLVGGVHLVIGGFGGYQATKRLRAVHTLGHSREELKKSVEGVTTAGTSPPRAIEESHA